MTLPDTSPSSLVGVRRLIDGIDDALLALTAGRRRLVSIAAELKQRNGLPLRDPEREREVLRRARSLGQRLGLPSDSTNRLMTALIQDARGQQGLEQDLKVCLSVDPDQSQPNRNTGMLTHIMNPQTPISKASFWLRLLPPPSRLSPFFRRVPFAWQGALLEAAMRRVLATPIANGALDLLIDRRLGIEVSDLGLRWVVALREGCMQVCAQDETAEATVRGTATDLLLLASRREDADTLFFQRRLALIGDTDLGLTARNLLDQLPWQQVPLGLRIALHRGADFALAARTAHGNKSTPG